MMFEPQPCCKAGHEYTPDNTWLDKVGHRRCRTCARAAEALSKDRRDELLRAAQGVRSDQAVSIPPQAANHNIYDQYSPQCPEPDPNPVPTCGYLGQMLGPFGGPDAAPWRR